VSDWWRRALARGVTRLRNEGPAALQWSLRITVAAVASYLVGTAFFPGTHPLLAPLTAMLVVQVTPVSLLASGLDRVVAVVAGVAVAVAFSAAIPLAWWSLGILILVALTIGQALRLRANLMEVAISAMLVLGVGQLGAESAAWQRIAETLVGAVVGIAANLLFPPKVASTDAGRAIDGLADSLSELLGRAADELARTHDRGDLAHQAGTWLGDARRITHDIPRAGAALLHAEQGRRLNVRAVGRPDAGPGLRQGLEALEHSAVAIRGMFRALVDAAHRAGARDATIPPSVVEALAQTFREMAASLDAFGELVRGEADPHVSPELADIDRLRTGLTGLHDARGRLDALLESDAVPQLPELLELLVTVLATVKRLQHELDLDERMRRQIRLLRSKPRLPRPGPVRPRSAPVSPEPTPEAETQVLPVIPAQRRRRRPRRRP
jgi:uncharacterized membrane protein YccC